jgi:hypothetical protein
MSSDGHREEPQGDVAISWRTLNIIERLGIASSQCSSQ